MKTQHTRTIAYCLWTLLVGALFALPSGAWAREVNYSGNEESIHITPGEPTQISFPGKVEGGFKRSRSSLSLDRQDNNLIVFSKPDLSVDGEAIIIVLEDKRTYSLRMLPSSTDNPRDGFVNIIDNRDPEVETEDPNAPSAQPTGFAPSTTVSGLMREMILVSEFGKKRGISGYRRSNRYSGETILHDGTVEAKIDEIFMGPDLWGYVVSIENLLDSTHRLDPATFRLDGTRAISAQRWELSPRPLTAEQQISDAHKGKVYIITKAKN